MRLLPIWMYRMKTATKLCYVTRCVSPNVVHLRHSQLLIDWHTKKRREKNNNIKNEISGVSASNFLYTKWHLVDIEKNNHSMGCERVCVCVWPQSQSQPHNEPIFHRSLLLLYFIQQHNYKYKCAVSYDLSSGTSLPLTPHKTIYFYWIINCLRIIRFVANKRILMKTIT